MFSKAWTCTFDHPGAPTISAFAMERHCPPFLRGHVYSCLWVQYVWTVENHLQALDTSLESHVAIAHPVKPQSILAEGLISI